MTSKQREAMQFPYLTASEAASQAPPVYWDENELFLRVPIGSVTMLYATYSNCKTTFAVCESIAIAKRHNARVLYIAAEGSGFIGPKTIMGAFIDWNNTHPDDPMTWDWLNEHFRLVTKPPQLLNPANMHVLKGEYLDWKPELIFIDTLGAAAAGYNLAGMEVGTGIGKNAREFSQEPYPSDVFLVHHIGKDKEKGATGSQYFGNDPDQALQLTYSAEKGLLEVKVTKARGGEQNRKVMFGVRVVGLGTAAGSTVAVYPFPKGDPRAIAPSALPSERDLLAEQVTVALCAAGPPGELVDQNALLDRLVVKEPREVEAEYQNRRADWRKNKLPRLVWNAGNKVKGIPGRPGVLHGLLYGVAREHPAKPKQPFIFKVPALPQAIETELNL